MNFNYETAANIAAFVVPAIGGLVAVYKIRCDKNNPSVNNVCTIHHSIEETIKTGLKELREAVDSLRDEILEIYKRGV